MKSRLLKSVSLLIIALTACSSSVDPKVGVRGVAADLVFGIPTVEEPVGLPGGVDFTSGVEVPPDFFSRPRPSSPIVEIPECEEASSRQYRFIADNVFQNSPPLGEFRWRVSGFAKLLGSQIPVLPFHEQTIQNLKVSDPDPQTNPNPKQPLEYEFETVLPDSVGQSHHITTWHVVRNRFVRPPGNVADPRQAPGNGLFIKKIVKFRAGEQTTFEPNPEVLVMPFGADADNGDQFGFQVAYVDSDASTQETWQLQGQIFGNVQFDACGEVIDTRWVDGYLKITSSGGTDEINWDFGVATQYGAILIAERREQCPRDFHYVHALGIDGETPPEDENHRCQRTSGAGSSGPSVERKPVDSKIERNIGQIPPDPS